MLLYRCLLWANNKSIVFTRNEIESFDTIEQVNIGVVNRATIFEISELLFCRNVGFKAPIFPYKKT